MNNNFTRQLAISQATGSIEDLIQKMNEPIFEDGKDLPVEWRGASWLRQIAILGQSCFVMGERGSGKKTAAALAEFDLGTKTQELADALALQLTGRRTDDLPPREKDRIWDQAEETLRNDRTSVCDFKLVRAADHSKLVSVLWDECDQELPSLESFQKEDLFTRDDRKAKKPPIRAKTKGLQAWVCPACNRNCRVFEGQWSPHGEDDHDLIATSVSMIEGPCPLKFDMLVGNAVKLTGKKYFIAVEETSKEAIKILELLVENAVVIFLVTPPQLVVLDKLSPPLRALPRHNFPKPTFDVFKAVADLKGITHFANDYEVAAAAFLSNKNLGEFLNLSRQVASNLLGFSNPRFTVQQLVQTAMVSAIEPSSMALVARLINQKIATARELESTIIKTFGVTLSPRQVGILFNAMQPILKDFPALTQPVSTKALPASTTASTGVDSTAIEAIFGSRNFVATQELLAGLKMTVTDKQLEEQLKPGFIRAKPRINGKQVRGYQRTK